MIERPALDDLVGRLLACPQCHSALDVAPPTIACRRCGFRGALVDGVVSVAPQAGGSFFDARHDVMQHGNESDAIRCLCYERQARTIAESLRTGAVVLDVGCGPKLAYARPPGVTVIGLDASAASLMANRDVDVRVHGTATALPLPSQSVDTALCLYAVHHMVGRTVGDNHRLVHRALSELARVVRPGGDVFIFEVAPWRVVSLAQRALWNTAKAVLHERLDMYFWPAAALTSMMASIDADATVETMSFRSPWFTTFPPVFSVPWLKIPRCVYPFDICAYHWRL